MTMYAGEILRVTATAEELNGDDMTDLNVSSAKVTIYDSEETILVNAADMTWEATELLWYYKWDTTGLDPGSYRARVVFTGLDAKSSWEWRRIRLARNPITV